MATRIQSKCGHGQYRLQTKQSKDSDIQTEFCVRASKLDLNANRTNVTSVCQEKSDGGSQKALEDNIDKKNKNSNPSEVYPTTPVSLTEFSRLANRSHSKFSTLGVMGRKYLKKPTQTSPNKATESKKTQEFASVPEDASKKTEALGSQTPLRGKGGPQRSSYVPSEFGFRKIRTDTFSGLSRKKNSRRYNLEKDIAEGARRHIIACQIAPTARRGCRAVQNYYALRDCVSPTGRFHRQMSTKSQNSASTVSIESISKPFASQLKSSKVSISVSATSMASLEKEVLPEVIGRVIHKAAKSQKLFEIV